MTEWQPIKTAPKDGQQIIVFCADGQVAVAEYYEAEDGFCGWEIGHNTDGKRSILCVRLTHWMPLPASPELAE